MRLTFLGTGGIGNPPIGLDHKPTWTRYRGTEAIAVQPHGPTGPTLLVDAGPHLSRQWIEWAQAPPRPDAVVITHGHADHMLGIGSFLYSDQPVPVYATAATTDHLRQFLTLMYRRTPEAMRLQLHLLPERGTTMVGDTTLTTFPLCHSVPLTGQRLDTDHASIALLDDTNGTITDDTKHAITDVDALIVNTPFLEQTTHHIGAFEAIRLAAEVNARRLILTHLMHPFPPRAAQDLQHQHPNLTVTHDGMVIDIEPSDRDETVQTPADALALAAAPGLHTTIDLKDPRVATGPRRDDRLEADQP